MLTRRGALRTIGSGAALGLLASGGVAAACLTASAASDPLLALIEEYTAARSAAHALPVGTSDECRAYESHLTAHVDPIFWRLAKETPQATTAAGALAALTLMRENCFSEDGAMAFDEPLLRAAMRFLEEGAA